MTVMLEQRIGLIGAGQMATALARGLIEAGLSAADRLTASDVEESARQRFTAATAAAVTAAARRSRELGEEHVHILPG